jgi:hypothetical protein
MLIGWSSPAPGSLSDSGDDDRDKHNGDGAGARRPEVSALVAKFQDGVDGAPGASARGRSPGARRPAVAVSPDLAGFTIATATKELAARRLSAVELVEETLATVDRDNERLNAYLHVDRKGALAAARRADMALDDGSAGPLAGIPICVKEGRHPGRRHANDGGRAAGRGFPPATPSRWRAFARPAR